LVLEEKDSEGVLLLPISDNWRCADSLVEMTWGGVGTVGATFRWVHLSALAWTWSQHTELLLRHGQTGSISTLTRTKPMFFSAIMNPIHGDIWMTGRNPRSTKPNVLFRRLQFSMNRISGCHHKHKFLSNSGDHCK
jgi:hypothetical protein